MSWITLTIIAQFLNSIVALIDKYLVTSKRVTTPLLYVFYTGVLAFLGVLIYIPSLFTSNAGGLPKFSSVTLLSPLLFVLLIMAVCAQLLALWGLFSALKRADASDVMPVIGSLAAVFALVISYVVFQTVLPANFTLGFGLLVIGTLFVSHLRFTKKVFNFTVLSALGFAVYGILLKEVLNQTSFDAGFFWFSIGMTICSFALYILPSIRKSFTIQKKEKHIKTTGVILLSSKIIAGIAGILLIKAIEIGEVSMVQALGGLQFLFLFVFAVVLGPYTSVDFGENNKKKDVYQKLVAVTIIFFGFIVLFT